MTTVAHIKLQEIPEHMEPGDAVTCTIDDVPYHCEFVQYGMSDRFVWVKIDGLREISGGKLTTQLDMFKLASFVTEFEVNDAPGRTWHRTAMMGVEIE